MKSWLAPLILFFGLPPSFAQPAGGPSIPPLQAVPLNEPVKLDGMLSESVWQRPGFAGLTQDEPDNGAEPRQPTDWWIAYDREADESVSASGWAGLVVRPMSALKFSWYPSYHWGSDRSGWVTSIADPTMSATYDHRYVVGALE